MQRKTTTDPSVRVETGPLKLDDDWCGVFIRGDNSGYYAMLLQEFLKKADTYFPPEERDYIGESNLKGLSKILNSSHEGPR